MPGWFAWRVTWHEIPEVLVMSLPVNVVGINDYSDLLPMLPGSFKALNASG
jgi:hypothetical protein